MIIGLIAILLFLGVALILIPSRQIYVFRGHRNPPPPPLTFKERAEIEKEYKQKLSNILSYEYLQEIRTDNKFYNLLTSYEKQSGKKIKEVHLSSITIDRTQLIEIAKYIQQETENFNNLNTNKMKTENNRVSSNEFDLKVNEALKDFPTDDENACIYLRVYNPNNAEGKVGNISLRVMGDSELVEKALYSAINRHPEMEQIIMNIALNMINKDKDVYDRFKDVYKEIIKKYKK